MSSSSSRPSPARTDRAAPSTGPDAADGAAPSRGARPGTGRWRGIFCLATAAALAAMVAPAFRSLHVPDVIVPGPGVTGIRQLSEWLPSLAGSPGETPVYVMQGHEPGGTMLVLGGTHADEPAGYLAAVLLVERAEVTRGTLLVVPRANASGFTHNIGQEAHPSHFLVPTARGPRRFGYGARATNPVHQWPDPQVYTHAASGQTLSGIETRNLNRAYPGVADGSLTERIAAAITALIAHHHVDLAVDLHEASPEYPVVNAIVAHERAMDVAALVNVGLAAQGIDISLETSPTTLHGLSHREWGDATDTLAALAETTNPAQGRLRGRTDAALVTTGRDRFYANASAAGRLSMPYGEGWPLDLRVARHVATLREFIGVMAELTPDHGIIVEGLPRYEDLVVSGVGRYLQSPLAPAEGPAP